MSESASQFREEIRHVIKTNDPDADELRELAGDLETLADRWDELGELV